MTTLIISGFNSPLLISQGFGAEAVDPPPDPPDDDDTNNLLGDSVGGMEGNDGPYALLGIEIY